MVVNCGRKFTDVPLYLLDGTTGNFPVRANGGGFYSACFPKQEALVALDSLFELTLPSLAVTCPLVMRAVELPTEVQ